MRVFFDTNILVHAQEAGPKGETARALLVGGGMLSVQVLNEFAAISLRKLSQSWPDIDAAIADVLNVVSEPVPVTIALHHSARRLAAAHGFAFHDALIGAAAIEAGCDSLYSEDMQQGRSIAGATIVNPFLGSAP